MRELELAGIPSIDPTRQYRDGRFPLSRTAFIASILAHVLAGYALSRHVWPGSSLPQLPVQAFFLFERPTLTPAPAPAPAPRVAEPITPPTVVVEPPSVEPRLVEPPRVIEPRAAESAPATESAPPATEAGPAPVPRAYIDFDEERRRAANQVIGSRTDENEYLTFSIDDVAPPRPEAEPEPRRSIFDGTGGTRGPTVGQVGQARTKFGHKVSALCNALTGGFSLMGFGSFCAGPSDGEPSGLFPEVRPAYLDLMPECVDTRDTAPALALEAPFPTVKCRLVKQVELEDQP